MSKRKVYQVIGYLNTSIQIVVDGKKKRIEFRGGSRNPSVTHGKFVTEDKDVQKALESGKLFKTLYKLIKIDDKLTEPIKKEVSPQAKIKQLTELNANLQQQVEQFEEEETQTDALKAKVKEVDAYKVMVTEQAEEIKTLKAIVEDQKDALSKLKVVEEPKEEGPKLFPDVLNMQAARDVLVKEYGQDIGKIPNGKAVLNKAKELKVSFPNWKI